MDDLDELAIDYERINQDAHKLIFGSQALDEIVIDFTGIPNDVRSGTSVKLLCAACLNCFAETFAEAMKARGAVLNTLKGKAVAMKEKDDLARTRVGQINIRIEAGFDDVYLPVFEKCRKIMMRGCLITYSLEDTIEIDYEIVRI